MTPIILNSNLEVVSIVDAYESFIWVERYSSYGDFELYLQMNTNYLNFMIRDYFVILEGTTKCMMIENLEITTDHDDGNKILVSGRSLESLLSRRIVWSQTTITGSLQNGVKKLIDESIIIPLDSNRIIPNFVFAVSTDVRVTSLTLDAQFTGDNLYDAIKKICDANNLGFKVTFENDLFIFELFYGSDRSYEQINNPYVIFSPTFDNLLNSKYVESGYNLKTVALVGGEGEGSSRKMTQAVSDASKIDGLARREVFVDARDLSQTVNGVVIPEATYLLQLEQRGLDKLSELNIVKTFNGQVYTKNNFKFGVDYFIGDIVQIENEYGMETTSMVVEFIKSNNKSGIDEYPTFKSLE